MTVLGLPFEHGGNIYVYGSVRRRIILIFIRRLIPLFH